MSTEQQAFPVVVDGYLHEGMTIRDYFAATAMRNIEARDKLSDYSYKAKRAYELADAMMSARGETK